MSFNEIVISTALRYITLVFSTSWIIRCSNKVGVGQMVFALEPGTRDSFLLLLSGVGSVELEQWTLAVELTAKTHSPA